MEAGLAARSPGQNIIQRMDEDMNERNHRPLCVECSSQGEVDKRKQPKDQKPSSALY